MKRKLHFNQYIAIPGTCNYKNKLKKKKNYQHNKHILKTLLKNDHTGTAKGMKQLQIKEQNIPMDQNMGNRSKEQVFFIMAKGKQLGVYESSIISFVLNTYISSWETQTSVGWQNLQMKQNVQFIQIQKGL